MHMTSPGARVNFLLIPTTSQLYPLSLLPVSGASAVAASPIIGRVTGCQLAFSAFSSYIL